MDQDRLSEIIQKLTSDKEKEIQSGLQDLKVADDPELYENIVDWDSIPVYSRSNFSCSNNSSAWWSDKPKINGFTLLALTDQAPAGCPRFEAFAKQIYALSVSSDFPSYLDAKNFDGIEGLSISSKDYSGNIKIHDHGFLKRFPNLVKLKIDITGMDYASLPCKNSLKELEIVGDTAISDLAVFSDFPVLQTLKLKECGSLKDLKPLYTKLSLQHLDLTRCSLVSLSAAKRIKAQLPWCKIIAASGNEAALAPLTTIKKAETKDDTAELNKLLDLLQSGDDGQVEAGMSFLAATGKPYYYETLLGNIISYWEYQLTGSSSVVMTSENHFGLSDALLFRLFAEAPETCERLQSIKEQIKELRTGPVKYPALPHLPKLFTLDIVIRDQDTTPLLTRYDGLGELKISGGGENLSTLAALKGLVKLTISRNKTLTDLTFVNDLPSLKELILEHCPSLRNFNDIRNTKLDRLEFKNCSGIDDMDALADLLLSSTEFIVPENVTDFGPLSRMTALESICFREHSYGKNKHLKALPDLHALTHLKTLDLSCCPNLSDLSGIARLPMLEEINLNECHSLDDLKPLESLSNLKRLSLVDSSGTGTTPAKLRSLKGILPDCEITDPKRHQVKPPLKKVKKLGSDDKKNFDKLKKLITSTKEDQIDTGLAMLDGLDRPDFYDALLEGICDKKPPTLLNANAKGLVNKFFTSSDIKQKTVLRLIAKAPSGTSAEKWKAGVETIAALGFLPEGLASFTNLKSLQFGWGYGDLKGGYIEDLSFLKDFPRLETLAVEENEGLKELSGLSYVTQLRELDLSGCTGVQDISALSHLKNLEVLTLARMGEFNTSPINQLKKLKTIDLSSSKIKVLELHDMADLNVLKLDSCSSLEVLELRGLSSFSGSESFGKSDYFNKETKYIDLRLPDRLGVRSLDGFREQISQCESLRVDLPKLEDISLLIEMPKLKKLILKGSPEIDLSPLPEILGLEMFELMAIKTDGQLEAVCRCRQLKDLVLSNCQELSNFSALSNMSQLRTLELNYCSGITDFSFLETMTQLEILMLNFRRAWHRQSTTPEANPDLSPLRKLTELRELHLHHSKVLEDLSLFSEMKKLEVLNIQGCSKVSELTPLETHSSLKSLDLRDCQGLDLEKAKALSAKIPACRIEVPSGRVTL